MCGIVGIISGHNNGFSQPEVDTFTRMLFLDTFRGWDSTGLFGADRDGNVQILKKAVNGAEFLGTNEYKAFSSKLYSSGKFAVGHNRAATRGTVNDTNAHPFWVDEENKKLVLVQNGTWFGDHKHVKNSEVDTEALLHLIATEDSIQEAVNKISAAYALVWYDVLNRQLNFLRNEQRPLHIATVKSGAVLFASEWETIEYAVNKTGWKYDREPFQLKENSLWTLTFDKHGNWTGVEKEVKKVYASYGGGSAAVVPFHPPRDTQWQEPKHGTNGWKKGGERGRHITAGQPNEYKHTFLDAFKPTTDDLIPVNQKALVDEVMQEAWSYFKGPNSLLVEVFDYFPANDHPDCTIHHIAARLVTPLDNSLLDHIVCYWTLARVTESDCMSLVQQPFYNVEFNGLSCFKTTDGYVIAARCTTPKLVTFVDSNATQAS